MKKLIGFTALIILLALTTFAQQDEKPNPNVKEIIIVF